MRRGLGRGAGQGYRNILPTDKKVHFDSRMGIKQPQRLPNLPLPTRNANRWPVQVGIIVPSTGLGQKKLTKKEFLNRIVEEEAWFTEKFGGDTSVMTAGRIRQKGRIVVENGSWVFSSMPRESYIEKRKEIVRHVLEKQKEWHQDNILLKVEGVDFVLPKNPELPDEKRLKSIPVG